MARLMFTTDGQEKDKRHGNIEQRYISFVNIIYVSGERAILSIKVKVKVITFGAILIEFVISGICMPNMKSLYLLGFFSNVETIIPELFMSTDLLSFEHPSVLLFCLFEYTVGSVQSERPYGTVC